MKQKIIIEFDDEHLDHLTALDMVKEVCRQGKISETIGVKQFCFVTVFGNGRRVYARPKRDERGPDSFKITTH